MAKALLVFHLILLAALAPWSLDAASPPADGASQFVDLMAKGDFASASARFDDKMRQLLPETKLKQTWEAVESQAGPFSQRLGTREFQVGGAGVFLVTCQFQKMKLDIKVALNERAQVSGLYFLPSGTTAETAGPPAYARTNSFEERPFTVGSGEWRLPGTLTTPLTNASGSLPAVVLIHGSGPNDRDETVAAVKPFRDLAWGLASKGIAVLRYEKRTREYARRYIGRDRLPITVREETIDDALTAANQLRETPGIDPKRVFVLGTSLGGTLAPRIGQSDPQLAGLVIMAGATRPLEDLVVEQTRYLVSLDGDPTPAEKEHLRAIEAAAAQVKRLTQSDEGGTNSILGAPVGYWLDLRTYNPVGEAQTLREPILILQGGRDYQVTSADFEQWKSGLSKHSNVTFKFYPDLNHLFLSGDQKSTPQDYDKPTNVSGVVVADIADWILTRH